MSDTILIIDYGSQYTQLIARKIREQNIYCVVKPYNKIHSLFTNTSNIAGIILSGGPNSVKEKNSPKFNKKILNLDIPILGICYGMQLLCKEFKGKIGQSKSREYGHAVVSIKNNSNILKGVIKNTQVWMSHGDTINSLPKRFKNICSTNDVTNAGFEIEGVWLATDALTVNANYSFTKTEYKDDVLLLEDENHLAPEPLFGATSYNLNGSSLKGIPEHKFTMWADYRWILPSDASLSLNGAFSYTGDYNTNSIERAYDKVPARRRVDTSLIWASADAKTRVRFFIDNLTDEVNFREVSQANHEENFRLQGTLLQARTWGVDFQRSFGG